MAIQTFTANLSKEGSTGSTRGKIPATLISAMGGEDGDVMEFQVNGKTLVGGRIIRGKEAQRLRASRQNFGQAAPSAPRKKVAPKITVAAPKPKANGGSAKKVVVTAPVRKTQAKAPVKVAPPAAKSSNRKTSVKVAPPAAKGGKAKAKPRFTL